MRAGSGVERAAFLLFAAVVVATSGGAARADERGPWAAGEKFPALQSSEEADRIAGNDASEADGGPAALPFIALVRLYQSFFSPVYGDRCPMIPSCSRYAVDAIRKHGPVVGIVMASGRLMHEADERRFAPIRASGARYLFFDPVESNDFWFGEK